MDIWQILSRAAALHPRRVAVNEGQRSFTYAQIARRAQALGSFLARRWGATSRIGALLDAVADKSLQFTALVTITLLGRPLFTQLPLWLVIAVFLRDFVLLAGWVLLRRLDRPVSFEHEIHGKVATTLVLGLVLAATLGIAEAILTPASALAAVASLLSAGAYIWRAFGPGRDPRTTSTR